MEISGTSGQFPLSTVSLWEELPRHFVMHWCEHHDNNSAAAARNGSIIDETITTERVAG